MLKKIIPPYCWVPFKITDSRIDHLLDIGAVAEVQTSGERQRKSADLVTFRTDGEIVDQFVIKHHTLNTERFVVSYNKKLRRRAAA